MSNEWQKDYERLTTKDEKIEIDFRCALLKSVLDRRFEQGLSQRELANKMGVKYSVVARFECGDTDPKLSTIAKMFNALGLELTVQPIKAAATAPAQPERIPIPACD